MAEPTDSKAIQRLTGQIAALGLFMSRSRDKCLPFFKSLKKAFEWISKCRETFQELKGGGQLYPSQRGRPSPKPIYYVSKVLQGAEIHYSKVEKFSLALVMAARKLRPYFKAHSIRVLTKQPLCKILYDIKSSGRMINSAIELREFDISYIP
ncbi:uncharacterized protein [Rutidosis leptorrhynchoides]|uniref:uncharacterized protein n=1 Tax=Rutidosis leptorrhynchoides TaxID=125765 RepID=UPI003A99B7AD